MFFQCGRLLFVYYRPLYIIYYNIYDTISVVLDCGWIEKSATGDEHMKLVEFHHDGCYVEKNSCWGS